MESSNGSNLLLSEKKNQTLVKKEQSFFIGGECSFMKLHLTLHLSENVEF